MGDVHNWTREVQKRMVGDNVGQCVNWLVGSLLIPSCLSSSSSSIHMYMNIVAFFADSRECSVCPARVELYK